jgi:hypothetical protein
MTVFMNFSKITSFVSGKKLTITAFVLGAFIASAGIVATTQTSSASAASNETNIGKQVVTVGKTKTTTQFNVCKISKGGGYYVVRVRASHSSAVLLANAKYRLSISSSHGSSTTANKYVSSRSAVTSTSNKGKVKSTATVTTYLSKGSSSGYVKEAGTTLRSFKVSSIRTC